MNVQERPREVNYQPVSNDNMGMSNRPNINWNVGATVVNGVMESMKGSELTSVSRNITPNNSARNLNNSARNIRNSSPPPQGNNPTSRNLNMSYDFIREVSTQKDQHTNSQLSLIQSRIEMLQKENSSLRSELNSKIY
jgi:hypothetical protein